MHRSTRNNHHTKPYTQNTIFKQFHCAKNTIPENITQNDALHRSTRNNHHTKPYAQNIIPENITQNDAMHRSYSNICVF